MKAYKILLFIIFVFSLLGAVSATIPDEGLAVTDSLTLRFPTPKQLLPAEENHSIIDSVQAKLAAEHIRNHIAMRRMSERMHMRHRVIADQVSIDFPNDSAEWLDPLFAAFDNISNEPIRIMHYGDSQIEEDRISSALRGRLQERFGGCGVGAVPPIQAVATSAIGQSSQGGTRHIVFGPAEMQRSDGHYGALGQSVAVNGTMQVTFYPINLKYTHPLTKQFSRITVIAEDIADQLTITINSGNFTETATLSNTENIAEIDMPTTASRTTITIEGNATIDAILLDSKEPGISLDNAAMRGSSGTILTKIAATSLAHYYNHYNVPLIILQYGGNTVPYIKGEKALVNYCNSLKQQIKYLQRISPDSKILFIGPSDMSTKINGKMQTYPYLPTIVDSLRTMCNRNDVAYWDLYRAMGGINSMASWVNASPQLAGADYIHFTRAGADHTSNMIFKALMLAYDYYTYRHSSENNSDTTAITAPDISIPTDSTIFIPIVPDTAISTTTVITDSI